MGWVRTAKTVVAIHNEQPPAALRETAGHPPRRTPQRTQLPPGSTSSKSDQNGALESSAASDGGAGHVLYRAIGAVQALEVSWPRQVVRLESGSRQVCRLASGARGFERPEVAEYVISVRSSEAVQPVHRGLVQYPFKMLV